MSAAAAAFGTPMEELLAQLEEANAETLAAAQAGQTADSGTELQPAKPAKPKKAKATIKTQVLPEAEPAIAKPVAKKRTPKLAATATPPLPPAPGEPSLWEIARIIGRKVARATEGTGRFVRLHLLRGHRQGLAVKKARAAKA